jgi:hypothetical protein
MENPLRIKRSFRIRHKILEVLYKDWESNGKVIRQVGSIKIATDTKFPIAQIHQFQYLLVDKGEITISDNDGQSMISLQNTGITSYIDKKYLKEGRKSKWDGIFDWARILIPLGVLILSIINYVSNRSLNAKVKGMDGQIKELQNKTNQPKK